MKTVVLTECEVKNMPDCEIFDLNKLNPKDCVGCWTCWWKTPGRCAFHDLDEFYHQYITADRVIIFAKVSQCFVSGTLKTLFDRLIPHFLPYVVYDTGESMHMPRYEKYPDIEFYYEGSFDTEQDETIFTDYIHRAFYQFHSKNCIVRPGAQWRGI